MMHGNVSDEVMYGLKEAKNGNSDRQKRVLIFSMYFIPVTN